MKRKIVKQHNTNYRGKRAEIEVVDGGFIVHLPWPHGNNATGLGKKVVKKWSTASKDIAEAFGLTETIWDEPA